MASLFQRTLLLTQHFLVPTYVIRTLKEITLSKGSWNVNQALVSQTSSILSTLSKKPRNWSVNHRAWHTRSSSRYLLQLRDAKDFVHLELRKRPYPRDYPCSTVVHTAFVVSAQKLQGASLWAPLVHVFIFRSSPSRQASFLRCITLNVSRLPVQSRVADDACEASLVRVALQLKRRCCHSFRPSPKVAWR